MVSWDHCRFHILPSIGRESLNLLFYNLKEGLSQLIHLVIVLKLTRHLPGIWAPWGPCHRFLKVFFLCVCLWFLSGNSLLRLQRSFYKNLVFSAAWNWELFFLFLLSVFYKAFQSNDFIQVWRKEKKLLDPSQQNAGNKCPSVYVELHSLTSEFRNKLWKWHLAT